MTAVILIPHSIHCREHRIIVNNNTISMIMNYTVAVAVRNNAIHSIVCCSICY